MISIYLSYDEGTTWPVKKRLIDGLSAYSSLTILPDGSIGCFVEEGKWDSNIAGEDGFRLYFMKFDLDWLTDGADVPDTDDIYDGTLNCDGTRYMYIDHSTDFDIPAGGFMTVTAKVLLDEYGSHRGILCNRWHSATTASSGNGSATGFDIYGGNSATQSMSNNVNLNKGTWNNLGHGWNNTLGTKEWAHIAWVLDGTNGTSKMYLNGTLVETKTNSDIKNYAINPQADMLVGARYNLDAYPCVVNPGTLWLGKIDDVRFYSKAMSDNEISADMTATVNESTSDLIAAYDFSEITGLSVTDISGNGHTGTLVGFPENSPGYTLTITPPSIKEGTLEVYDGTTQIVNGRKIAEGSELTIVATPAESYLLTGIYINGEPIEGNTFIMEANTTVSATFERDPDAPVEYCFPTGNATRTDTRGITSLTVSESGGNTVTVNGAGTNGTHALYVDATASILTTSPGATITIKNNGSGTWMSSYVYIDYDNNGTFDFDPAACIGANIDGELVCHTGYSGTEEDPTVACDGVTLENNSTSKYGWQIAFNFTLPTFTIPADLAPGDYRIRHKVDFNCVDPCGRLSANGFTNNFMDANGGGIIDFTIRIPDTNHSLTLISTEGGSVEAWTSRSSDMQPEGTQIASGDIIPTDASNIYFWFTPSQNYILQSAIVSTGLDQSEDITDNTVTIENGTKYVWDIATSELSGDITMTVTFHNDTQSIDAIGIDPANGPIEIYNLNGIKVNAENLVPGIYIIRQSNKSYKVRIDSNME